MFDVLTIGTATRDVYLASHLFKSVKDPHFTEAAGFPVGEAECFALGSKIEVDQILLTTGGGATNTAVTFSRQGLRTACLFKIGRDEAGQSVVADLKKEGVESLPVFAEAMGTGYATILLNPDGERTILVYRGAAEDLTVEELPPARWAYLSPSHIAPETLGDIFKKLTDQKTLIAINPSKFYLENKGERLKPFLKELKVVILNREEAGYWTGVDYRQDREIFRKLDELVGGIAVMTDGPKGVVVSDGQNIYRAGIFPEKKVIDRTGAGDAFGSGFVTGLIQKSDDIAYAIRLASANATAKVETIGAKTGLLTKKDFETEARWQNLEVKRESF